MNSYPVHFLSHHLPLMFVAGLEPAPSPPPPDPSSSSDPAEPSSSKPPTSTSSAPKDEFEELTTRLRAALTAKGKTNVWEPAAEYGRAGTGAAEKKKTFRIVLADKDVRLPPAKVSASGSSAPAMGSTGQTLRSPLSPFVPTSPLYPDGLIAPIWVRKHTDLVPSVFVLFLRLSEEDDELLDKSRDEELVKELVARKKVLSERGIKLTVVLIASRELLDNPTLDPRLSQIRRQSSLDSRASLFVLTPVTPSELSEFVQSLQDVLYEPALDYYEKHSKRVRRKRAKFGAGSVPGQASGAGAAGGLGTVGGAGKGLGREGWIVRYEYKAGAFAEMRGELDLARKHYEQSWTELSLMFHSTSTLPPRTKRWAEAKVLADCVAIKICKLYLYANETSRALAFFKRHLSKFEELSRGWGISEDTFEFWSWVARQYRIFAELLEMGMQSGLSIPVSPSLANPSSLNAAHDQLLQPSTVLQHPGFYYYSAACCTEKRKETFRIAMEAETDAANSEAGQHSGYVSASPGFANEKKVDHSALIIELFTKSYELLKTALPPHSSSSIEPSSSIYSPHPHPQSRLTLYIASRIASAYALGGQHEMALRFFERIGKVFRREKWDVVVRKMRKVWLECARKTMEEGSEGNDKDGTMVVVRLLVEMLGDGGLEEKDWVDRREELGTVLKNLSSPLDLSMSGSLPPLIITPIFYLPTVLCSNPIPYQITIAPSTPCDLSSLPVSSLLISFTDGSDPIEVHHLAPPHPSTTEGQDDSSGTVVPAEVRLVSLDVEDGERLTADLRLGKGGKLVLAGSRKSEVVLDMRVSSITVVLQSVENESAARVRLVYDQSLLESVSSSFSSTSMADAYPPQWLASRSPPTFVELDRPSPFFTSVLPKPHLLQIDISHPSPAYVEESYPIQVNITNSDSRSMDLWLDVLIYPPEEANQGSGTISIDEHTSASMLKQIPLGTLEPSANLSKTLTLLAEGLPTTFQIDVSVQSRLTVSPSSPTLATVPSPQQSSSSRPASPSQPEAEPELEPATEHLHTLTVPAILPFRVSFDSRRFPSRQPRRSLLDPSGFEEGGEWEKEEEAGVTLKVDTIGDWDVEVVEVKFKEGSRKFARGTFNSLDGGVATFPKVWRTGDRFALVSHFDVGSGADDDGLEEDDRPLSRDARDTSPGWYDLTWKRASHPSNHPLSHSIIPLPPLLPSSSSNSITTSHITSHLTLHQLPSCSSTAAASAPLLTLQQPLILRLTIHNLSSSLSSSLQLQIDTSDSFSWAGPRSLRLPLLLSSQSRVVEWRAVPLRGGWVDLPLIRLWEVLGEGDDGDDEDEDEGGRGQGGGGKVETRDVKVELDLPGAEGEATDAGRKGGKVFVYPA